MAEAKTYKPGSADNYVNPKTGKRAFDISKVPFNTNHKSEPKPKQKSEMSDEEIIDEMSRRFTL